MHESWLQKWSWKIANFTTICIQNIVTDIVVSEIVQKWITCGKLRESWLQKWSWKTANLIKESHGKVMDFHFQGFVGTLVCHRCLGNRKSWRSITTTSQNGRLSILNLSLGKKFLTNSMILMAESLSKLIFNWFYKTIICFVHICWLLMTSQNVMATKRH